MPLMICQVNGRRGWKWGPTGKCYFGKDAKKRALEQGKAIAEAQKQEQVKEQL